MKTQLIALIFILFSQGINMDSKGHILVDEVHMFFSFIFDIKNLSTE